VQFARQARSPVSLHDSGRFWDRVKRFRSLIEGDALLLARVDLSVAPMYKRVCVFDMSRKACGAGAKKASFGDDEAYDSDEYEETKLAQVQVGKEADAENWGEFEDEHDDWGTSGAAALAAKKKAQRAAAAEGRIYTEKVSPSVPHALLALSLHDGPFVSILSVVGCCLGKRKIWCQVAVCDVLRPGIARSDTDNVLDIYLAFVVLNARVMCRGGCCLPAQ
jgi:hypothetical protein